MDLRHLKYFIAVAEARNFTRAAELLHIAQPPLSRQIQLLEEELGVSLLSRSSRPLRLTDAGRVFYEQALQIVGRLDQLKTSTQQVGLNSRATLSIGFVASTLYGGLPMLVRKLRVLYPNIDVQLVELTSLQQITALKTGRIDIGFGRVRFSDPTVTRTVLREERLVLAVAPRTQATSPTASVSLKDVGARKLIVYPKEPRPSFADHVLSLLSDQGIQPAEIHEVREIQTALGLVAAEVGVCVIPTSARLRNDLEYHAIDDISATSPIILTHRVNDVAWYVTVIKKLIADMFAEMPDWPGAESTLGSDSASRMASTVEAHSNHGQGT